MTSTDASPPMVLFSVARARIDRIKTHIDAAREDLIEAWRQRDWVTLGYESWDHMCEVEFDGARISLPVDERRELVGDLRAEGMSTRAIGSAIGVSKDTVHRDLSAGVSDETPAPAEPVTGLDGKVYSLVPPPKPKRKPGRRRWTHTPELAEEMERLRQQTPPVTAVWPQPTEDKPVRTVVVQVEQAEAKPPVQVQVTREPATKAPAPKSVPAARPVRNIREGLLGVEGAIRMLMVRATLYRGSKAGGFGAAALDYAEALDREIERLTALRAWVLDPSQPFVDPSDVAAGAVC